MASEAIEDWSFDSLEAEQQIGYVLNASNIQPETADGYVELLEQGLGAEKYSEIYRKGLTNVSYHLLNNLLDIDSGSRVLDVGCGVDAPLYRVLEEELDNFDYTGVDAVSEIVEENREQFPDAEFLDVTVPYDMDEIEGGYDQVVFSLFFDALNKPETALTLLQTDNLLELGGEVTATLSSSREEEISFIADTLASMGYHTKPGRYRLDLKEGESESTKYFYVLRTRKDMETDFSEWEEDFERCCDLRKKDLEDLSKEYLEKAAEDLKVMQSQNRFPRRDRHYNADYLRSSLESTGVEDTEWAMIKLNLLRSRGSVSLEDSPENEEVISWIEEILPQVRVEKQEEQGNSEVKILQI
ncbi:MAG: trans-aconitate 2-methyltransferase [Candidatus Nanohaloarchaea archaeon]